MSPHNAKVPMPPDSDDQTADDPRFSELTPEECEQLLSRLHVGRIAFPLGATVDIEPISFTYDAGWLFGRTSPGTKLTALGHRPWVAFEVDEARGPFDWESVVVHGSFRILEPAGSDSDVQLYERAMTLLRAMDPSIGTARDPVPFRTTVFGIHVDEMTGRRATDRT